ncbi:uncharacterized protein LOC100372715 [Saccoglossus kowalevskii]|uniref:Transcription initiation factor TFIID subunit 3-like n=1 Tax=Saccoglossus kowalevskii TaxID=10224 RepID=A0ABM0M151_SACKO|nr:PREDICTED: transcription initiation factor TFIID subunit 3-like [Saccoglossus kowalevskii]
MAEGFTRSLLKVVVAQICQSLGWQAVQTTPCDLLTDILERYIGKLAETTHSYAEQYNRTEPNLDDLSYAFRQLGISIAELEDYTNVVEQIPFAHELPQFPFVKNNALHHPKPGSSEHRERLIYIPDYLPPLVQYPEDADGLGSPISGPSGSVHEMGGEPVTMDQTSPRTPGRGEKRERNSILHDEPSSKRLRISEDGTPQELTAISMTPQGVLTPKREGKLPDATTPPQSKLPSALVTAKSATNDEKEPSNEKDKDKKMPPPTVLTPSKSRAKSPKSPKGGGGSVDSKATKLKEFLLHNKPNSPKGGSKIAKSPERSRTSNKKSPIRTKSPAKHAPPSSPPAITPILTGLLSTIQKNGTDQEDIEDVVSESKESKLVPASDKSMDASIEAVIVRAQKHITEKAEKQEIKEENVEIKKEKKEREREEEKEKEKEKFDVNTSRLSSVESTIEAVIQRSQQQFAEEQELKAKQKEQKPVEPPKSHDPYDFIDDDSPAPPTPLKEQSPSKPIVKKMKRSKEQEKDKKMKVKKFKIKDEKRENVELKKIEKEKPAENIPPKVHDAVKLEGPVKLKDKAKKKDKKEKKDKHKEIKKVKEKKIVKGDKKDSSQSQEKPAPPPPEKSVPLIPKISIKTKDFPKTTLTFSGLDLSQPKPSTVGSSATIKADMPKEISTEKHHEKAKKKKKDKHKERHKEKHRDKEKAKHKDKEKHKKEKHKDNKETTIKLKSESSSTEIPKITLKIGTRPSGGSDASAPAKIVIKTPVVPEKPPTLSPSPPPVLSPRPQTSLPKPLPESPSPTLNPSPPYPHFHIPHSSPPPYQAPRFPFQYPQFSSPPPHHQYPFSISSMMAHAPTPYASWAAPPPSMMHSGPGHPALLSPPPPQRKPMIPTVQPPHLPPQSMGAFASALQNSPPGSMRPGPPPPPPPPPPLLQQQFPYQLQQPSRPPVIMSPHLAPTKPSPKHTPQYMPTKPVPPPPKPTPPSPPPFVQSPPTTVSSPAPKPSSQPPPASVVSTTLAASTSQQSGVQRSVITETLGSTILDSSGQKIWICPQCKLPDDGSPMIGCDTCDDWYHWPCVGITEEPSADEWYCKRCTAKKKSAPKKKKKKKHKGSYD